MAKIYRDKIIWEKGKPEEEEIEIEIPKESQQLLPFGRDKQDWHAYHLAKTQEKKLFLRLLHELCKVINEPEIKTNGRPKAKLRDLIFCLGIKLYSNYSGRKSYSDFTDAEAIGIITKAPGVNTLNDFLNVPATEVLLIKLIELSAMPLKELEDHGSIDSSGFGSYQYERWQNAKWKTKRGFKNYLKGHIVIGTRTNIICGCTITPGNFSDAKQAPMLIQRAGANFKFKEFSGDKAYNSKRIMQAVEGIGGTPFIPFKSNCTGKDKDSPQIWKDMFKFFQEKRAEFEHHYHKRSNVETVFSMVKVRLGEHLKCRGFIAQKNELLAKFLCHNICVLIQEMFERKVKIDFRKCLNEYIEVEFSDDYPETAERTYQNKKSEQTSRL